jgi:hypothetical protein
MQKMSDALSPSGVSLGPESAPGLGRAESAPDQRPIRRAARRRERAVYRGESPQSAENAKPRRVALRYGAHSALMSAEIVLDQRTREGKFERAVIERRIAHCGGAENVTEPLMSCIRHSARLELAVALCWAEVRRGRLLNENGEPSGALRAFLVCGRALGETLRLLGLERRERPVPNLEDYLRGEPPAAPEGKSPAPGEEAP